MTKVKNAFYAQSGGVTAVINASACGVIETVNKSKKIHKVLAGENGILGALNERLIDTSKETKSNIEKLKQTPGGAFGSCRFKLQDPIKQKKEYERLFEVFAAHDIGYFFYNGGGDSQDTTFKVSEMAKKLKFPLKCVGIPKTVDNDLPYTDCSPGFGSVAKYIATSTLEAGLDVKSMAETSTKVFILEVMGRHAGWIAAASCLASEKNSEPPHIILLPEVPFEKNKFLKEVKARVNKYNYCVIVASEGAKFKNGKFIADTGLTDAFGHQQLGGVAPVLASMVSKIGLKNHWAVADYLQRSARHIASKTDLEQAYILGVNAVNLAIKGKTGVMPIIKRLSNKPYRWKTDFVSLKNVANVEKTLPKSFISKDGYGISKKGREYLAPLIKGEATVKYKSGIPEVAVLKNSLVPKKLNNYV
ncbi:6-phosphofructokinase [Gammaproteobacteria bacterium]|nr:6-phosphofructokinase [Gammaproteobacteria bacterium]